MKKKLEADLISIAHRILKLKNKSDINQLYLETQKLYEKLAVLKFVDENFEEAKPTIGQSEIESKLETIFEKEEIIPTEVEAETPAPSPETAPEIVSEPEVVAPKTEESTEEKVIEANTPEEEVSEIEAESTEETIIHVLEDESLDEETEEPEEPEESEIALKQDETKEDENSFRTFSDLKPIPEFKPAFELTEEPKQVEEEKKEPESKATPIPILFEDLGVNYADAQFVKVESVKDVPPIPTIAEWKEQKAAETAAAKAQSDSKPVTLNEKLSRGFHIDLNDRIAFTKNLFGNSAEDYSRVLNQLMTFDSYAEVKDFIENMVKPDYNNWEGKDDYAERFMGIIEKKFL
ncbi:hypothetical protein [Flavobacterium foetidum]|uniref:hypothetical protein n=1 Tax=Flavobacterium foetidum TaxID=2026681 RepID=UPI001074F3F3|nr:hypothetical protein [Flavobacterium foetidum]KAF2509833.1 hypothetical protein E0W73_18185 [Flavobacterium foetidum]